MPTLAFWIFFLVSPLSLSRCQLLRLPDSLDGDGVSLQPTKVDADKVESLGDAHGVADGQAGPTRANLDGLAVRQKRSKSGKPTRMANTVQILKYQVVYRLHPR
jgi:hypothetical protein